jgi:23S rRNA (guanosine2251-2'-O)-methyltransferase
MERLVIGKNAVLEALKSENAVDKILVLYGMRGNDIEKIKKFARKKQVIVSEVNKQKFRELVGDATTQGVLAIITDQEYSSVDQILEIAAAKNEKPFILIADELADPHNLGALSRTAEAVGVHGIIFPKHHSTGVNQTTSKISSGASEHLSFAKVINVVNAIEDLKSKGVWIIGTDVESGKNYTEIDYNIPLAIIMGNEGKGVRKLVKEKCDFLVKIPMFGKVNSLNVSVAGGIIMYEVARKRRGF